MVFNNLQRVGDAEPRVSAQIRDVTHREDYVVSGSEINDRAAQRRLLPQSHEPGKELFQGQEVVAIDISECLLETGELFRPVPRGLMHHNPRRFTVVVLRVEVERLGQELFGAAFVQVRLSVALFIDDSFLTLEYQTLSHTRKHLSQTRLDVGSFQRALCVERNYHVTSVWWNVLKPPRGVACLVIEGCEDVPSH